MKRQISIKIAVLMLMLGVSVVVHAENIVVDFEESRYFITYDNPYEQNGVFFRPQNFEEIVVHVEDWDGHRGLILPPYGDSGYWIEFFMPGGYEFLLKSITIRTLNSSDYWSFFEFYRDGMWFEEEYFPDLGDEIGV